MKYIIFAKTQKGLDMVEDLKEEGEEVTLITDSNIDELRLIENKEDYLVIFDTDDEISKIVDNMGFDISYDIDEDEEDEETPDLEDTLSKSFNFKEISKDIVSKLKYDPAPIFKKVKDDIFSLRQELSERLDDLDDKTDPRIETILGELTKLEDNLKLSAKSIVDTEKKILQSIKDNNESINEAIESSKDKRVDKIVEDIKGFCTTKTLEQELKGKCDHSMMKDSLKVKADKDYVDKEFKDIRDKIKEIWDEIKELVRIGAIGGKSEIVQGTTRLMLYLEGVSLNDTFNELNFKAGTGITLTKTLNTTTRQTDLEIKNSLDLSGYFKLDQTTPQTIINGTPIFDKGVEANESDIETIGNVGAITPRYYSGNVLVYGATYKFDIYAFKELGGGKRIYSSTASHIETTPPSAEECELYLEIAGDEVPDADGYKIVVWDSNLGFTGNYYYEKSAISPVGIRYEAQWTDVEYDDTTVQLTIQSPMQVASTTRKTSFLGNTGDLDLTVGNVNVGSVIEANQTLLKLNQTTQQTTSGRLKFPSFESSVTTRVDKTDLKIESGYFEANPSDYVVHGIPVNNKIYGVYDREGTGLDAEYGNSFGAYISYDVGLSKWILHYTLGSTGVQSTWINNTGNLLGKYTAYQHAVGSGEVMYDYTDGGGEPYKTNSQTLNTNLNADLLDGLHASSFLQLDQTTPQTMSGGAFAGSGLIKLTSGLLGVDTNTYLTSESDPLAVLATGTRAGATSQSQVFTNGITLNATTLKTDTTTGLKIGSSNLEKIGFFGVNPRAQQASTNDLGVTLSSLGLMSIGANYQLLTSGDINFSGTKNFNTGTFSLSGIFTDSSTATHSGSNTFTNVAIIDRTSTEAFLVRKASDGGDVFTVDTANSKIIVGGVVHQWGFTGDEGMLVLTTDVVTCNDDFKVASDTLGLWTGAGADMKITYNGTAGVIDTSIVAPSDLQVNCGTDKTLILGETVWEDMQFVTSTGKVPAANYPTWEAFTTNTEMYAFSVDDKIQLETNEPPHGWKEGTVGSAHIHFCLKTGNTSGANQFAKFELIFAYSDYNGIWTEQAALTAETTIPTATSAKQSYLLTVGNVTLTGLHLGTQITCRARRIAATGGTEYADDVYITQVGVHLEKDTIGSRSITSK